MKYSSIDKKNISNKNMTSGFYIVLYGVFVHWRSYTVQVFIPVFLFDVSKNLHMLSSDVLAVSQ